MRHRADANSNEIVDALHSVGAEVIDLSQAGNGIPDKAVYFRGKLELAEIKNGRDKMGWKYTPSQAKFRKRYSVPVLLFDTVESVYKWANFSKPAIV